MPSLTSGSPIRVVASFDATRYLQYDLPTLLLPSEDVVHWPVLRPGEGGGLSFAMEAGTFYPLIIDGRAPLADETYALDLREAPFTAVTIVRIR